MVLFATCFTKAQTLQAPKDRIFRIFCILVPLMITIYVNDVATTPSPLKFGRLAITLFCTILICEGSRKLIYNSRSWFPKRRILMTFICGLLFTTLVLAFGVLARYFVAKGSINTSVMIDSDIYINGKRLVIGLIGNCFLNAVFIFPFLFACYEIFYQSTSARAIKAKNEYLEKEKLKAELQQLKGIVNPHFLFNNLNSLSALISENPQQAQDFLDELTKVFRYLIRNNQTELSPLSQELQFIQSYFNLLETRYGKGITLTQDINPAHLDLMLPPLTLQLLVENAAKHNAVHKDNPLHIEIRSDANQRLIIKNNIIPRKGHVESTGIGLQNIASRYAILNYPPPEIIRDGEFFKVSILLRRFEWLTS